MSNINSQTMPEASELGKKSAYEATYNPKKLFPIPRKAKRDEIGVDDNKAPFFGVDIWNHYEVSWLNEKGKPLVAIAVIEYDCTTQNIIESKSMKLYFNSFNNSKFKDMETVQKIMVNDLSAAVCGDVKVIFRHCERAAATDAINAMPGQSLDALDIECNEYAVNPTLLKTNNKEIEETLCSDLLKSNCLVTGQPDWGSVYIAYKGKEIDHASLLKYIVSFRNHNEFHEQCIERIFVDIMTYCQPEKLTVYGRYTRRGGVDINPYRSTEKTIPADLNQRLVRQ